MKNFVKEMDREESGVAFFKEKFPRTSMEKWCIWRPSNERTHEGPNVWRSIKVELSASQSLKSRVTNFRENNRSVEYEKEIEELLKSFRQLGTRISVKLYFLRSHLDYFSKNCGNFSEEKVSAFTKTFAL